MDSSALAARQARVIALAESLPEAVIASGHHLKFEVRKKSFAHIWHNHHGDGTMGLICKSTFGEQDLLLRHAPDRYYRPAYLGAHGWVALRLDLPEIDWTEVEDLLRGAYMLAAPKRLAALAQQSFRPD